MFLFLTRIPKSINKSLGFLDTILVTMLAISIGGSLSLDKSFIFFRTHFTASLTSCEFSLSPWYNFRIPAVRVWNTSILANLGDDWNPSPDEIHPSVSLREAALMFLPPMKVFLQISVFLKILLFQNLNYITNFHVTYGPYIKYV